MLVHNVTSQMSNITGLAMGRKSDKPMQLTWFRAVMFANYVGTQIMFVKDMLPGQ